MDDFALRTDQADRVHDRLAIADAAYLYAAAVDILGNNPAVDGREDAALAEAIEVMSQALTPDARLRLFLAGPRGPHSDMGSGGPAGVAHAVRAYFTAYGYVGTQHCVGNVRVAFTGRDSARATSRIPCFHWLADDRMMLAPVNYDDRLVRQDGVWKIAVRDVFAVRFWVTSGYAPDPLDPSLART